MSNSLGRLSVKAPKASFTPLGQYEGHFPGNYAREMGYDWTEGPQEKFVPGILTAKGSKVDFRFSIDSGKVGTFTSAKKDARKYVRAKAKESGWKMAAALSHFVTELGGHKAFMVGFPYFNEFWTRDFLWMAKPLMEKGFQEEVQGAMELLEKEQLKDGSIPNVAGAPGTNADSTPLWVIAADELIKRGGKVDGKKLQKAVEFGRRQLRSGLVEHPTKLTWMDTLDRNKAIEIQSLWVEAFDRGAELFSDAKLEDLAASIWEHIEAQYLEHEVFKDSLRGPYTFTANSLVPIFFGQASLGQRKKTVKRAKEELLTEHGLKAVSKKESGSPEAYHERVWGITTYWGLETLGGAAGRKMLEGYRKFLGSRTLFGVPETISGGVPLGATHQLWSLAFLPED